MLNNGKGGGTQGSGGTWIEPLEQRRLLSADPHLIIIVGPTPIPTVSGGAAPIPTLNAGLLNVDGTASADTISLTVSNDSVQVNDDGVTTDFALADVTEAVVFGFAGADQFSIGPNMPTTLAHGMGGADTISAANSAGDTLLGGAGRDSILGGPGNDSINAGAGTNTVNGGGGNDTIAGITSPTTGGGGGSTGGGGGYQPFFGDDTLALD